MSDPLPNSRNRYPFVFLDSVLFYFRETREDQQIHVIVKLEGRLDFTRLKRAVRLILDAEPILGCRLTYHPLAPWWERRADLDNLLYCRLVQTEDAESSVNAFLTAPLDPFLDPLVQVRVFRAHEDILVIKLSHLITDGGGSNEYLYLVADLYSRLKEEPDLKPAANTGGTRSLCQVGRRFTLLQKSKILRRSLRDLKSDCTYLLEKFHMQRDRRPSWGLPLKQANKEDRAFILRRLPAVLIARLKEHARSHGATLNDAMLTAFCRAIHELFAPRPGESMRIRTIANLRRYLPGNGGETLCNLCGYVPVNIGHHPGTCFVETLLRVRDLMLSHKADFIGLGVFPLSIVATRLLPFYLLQQMARLEVEFMDRGYVRPVPKFSNVGDMVSEKLSFDGLTVADAYQVGTIGYASAFTVGITGFRGALTLSVGICNASQNAPIFNRLFDGIEKEIRSALS